MGAARQHHIIPVQYLAGFTDTGTKEGRLHVFDYPRNRHFRTSPARVCRERDFYRIEAPGVDPNAIESEMANFEGRIASALQQTREAVRFTSARDVGAVLSLAALLAVRDRRGRQKLGEGLQRSLRGHLAEKAISEEKWNRIRESELLAGADPDEIPLYESAVASVREGTWTPPVPRILQVGLIPALQAAIRDVLVARSWEAMTTDWQRNGGFITSDAPLVWGSLEHIHDGYLMESLDDPDVEVTFPVCKSVALVSYPNARHGNCAATDAVVAQINMRTLQLSMGLVFHPEANFLLRPGGGEISTGAAYFQYVAEARRRGVEKP